MGEIAEELSERVLPARPTEAQLRYLARGLNEPGHKLPLFDRDGREIPRKTIEACIAHGWAEPWIANPMKPSWLVCRLTPAGLQVLDRAGPLGETRTGIARHEPI
jgi:hypothetical protein